MWSSSVRPSRHVRHAVAAIRSGQVEVVMIAHGESGRPRVGAPVFPKEPSSTAGPFELPYGVLGAHSRASSCLVNDGGGALVMTAKARAADLNLRYPPVVVAGSGESCEGPGPAFIEDLTTFRGFRDAFAHVPLYGLEDASFVGKGEAVDFIDSGATSPGGALPLNTNGGRLLYAHTGMYGMFALLADLSATIHKIATDGAGNLLLGRTSRGIEKLCFQGMRAAG